MHYRAISNLDVFRCEIINTAEQNDGLTSFLMLNVIEAKIFQYDCLEGMRDNITGLIVNTEICSRHYGDETRMKRMKKDEMLVTLVTISVAIFEPWDGF